jgi:hypothetical protein
MKTIHDSFSPFVVHALVTAACLSVTHEAAADVTLPSHAVTASDGSLVVDVEPGSFPDLTHPEGTVLAIVWPRHEEKARTYLAEIDVSRNETLHRANFECGAILRDKGRLYASCGSDFIAFDASTLGVLWRRRVAACRDRAAETSLRIVSSGAGRVAVLVECPSLQVRVLGAEDGAALGGTDTGLLLTRGADAFFHGRTLVVGGRVASGAATVSVLSPDYRRVDRTLLLAEEQWFHDDGVHLHVTQDVPNPDLFTRSARPEGMSDAEWDRKRAHGPSWLTAGRDVTVSDSFEPLSSRLFVRDPGPPVYRPEEASGEYVAYELDQGPQHFWLTRSCCGGETPGGLWVGKRPE